MEPIVDDIIEARRIDPAVVVPSAVHGVVGAPRHALGTRTHGGVGEQFDPGGVGRLKKPSRSRGEMET